MLLYGDSPPTGEPTLEMRRHPLPPDENAAAEARRLLEKLLTAWGWQLWQSAAEQCVSEVLAAVVPAGPETIELWAFRRAHHVTLEVHYCGTPRFHEVLGGDRSRHRGVGMVDDLVPLWGVRSLGDGEAVWFELR